MDEPLRCQFCDEHPGKLVAFGRSWACPWCINKYGLEDHPMFGGYDGDDYGAYGYMYHDYYYSREVHYQPVISGVTIEELPCDDDLSAGAKIRLYNLPREKTKEQKWQIDIWY
jgi:hypothetical protein